MTTSIGVQLNDSRAYITCHLYPARTPILAINLIDTSVSLSIDPTGRPTDHQLQAARDLVDAALAFQAEVERLACGAPTAVPS